MPYENKTQLRSGDLTLRSPEISDAEAVVEAVLDSLAELEPWMPWASASYDVGLATSWINGDFGDYSSFLLIEPDGSIVGTCGLNGRDELNKRANLGYWVRTDRTGRGYATTATRLVARRGLESGLQRLEVIMSTQNEASRRVAQRSGAHHEGIARDRLLLLGKKHDAHIYSFTQDDLAKLST